MENYNIPKLNLSESFSKQDSAWAEAIRRYEKENRGRRFRDLPEKEQQLLFMKSLSQFGLTMNNKGYIVRASKVNQGTPMNESVKALAEHVKKQVPLCDSIFRYQSEAYFDTFKTAKKLREAGALPELDWESEEMLGTDIGESVVLKGGERVWLDVPYLEDIGEGILEASDDDYVDNYNMVGNDEINQGTIGTPDRFYDAEERMEAYRELQDALAQSDRTEAEYVKDGQCPECPNVEDDEDCNGFGNYGCDDGILTYNGADVSWKAIQDHDEKQITSHRAKANYPGDEAVIQQAAKMMPNMDDPRMVVQQIKADYPFMGTAKASDLAGKAKQIAFPESVEIDQIRDLAGLNELKDERSDIEKIEDLLKGAIGSGASGGDMYELYAELESMDSTEADKIKLLAKEIYGVKLEEGKSPHKKGSKKYKKHMAAMHAEDLEERNWADDDRAGMAQDQKSQRKRDGEKFYKDFTFDPATQIFKSADGVL